MSVDLADPAQRQAALQRILPEQAKEHHAFLRQLFEAEVEYRRKDDDWDYYENLYWCAYLLFHVGDPSDTPAMWRAKHLNMDTGTGFDIEAMVGGGVEATVAQLQQQGLHAAAQAIRAHFAGEAVEEIRSWSDQQRRYYYGEA